MALNNMAACLHRSRPSSFQFSSSSSSLPSTSLLRRKERRFKAKPSFSPLRTPARSEGSEGEIAEEELPTDDQSSARLQLDLLEQLGSTGSSYEGYKSDGNSGKLTIRDQLAQLVDDRNGDFSIPLGKNLKKVSAKFLTISQKRNIRRQAYLNEVSQRNDSVFFATIGASVLLPPLVILAIAVQTGYVQLFP